MRLIRDIVERNPRFRRSLGTVTIPMNSNPTTSLRWNDLQVIMRSVSTSGNRLSPDYLIATQMGRAILCKVTDKDGAFIEWIKEVDPSRQTPDAGVYYLNLDFVSEETRELGLTVQKYKWKEGKLRNAVGSFVHFRPRLIDPGTAQQVDLNTLIVTSGETSLPVEFTALNASSGGTIALLTPSNQLIVQFANGQPLVPFIDFWYEREISVVICSSTRGGAEILNIPQAYTSMRLTDQDGYQLRPNIDFSFYNGAQWVQLAQWAPAGSVITANIVVKMNPAEVSATHPENILNLALQPNESLAPGQVFVHTSAQDFFALIPNPDGSATLPRLLQLGDSLRWEVRIDAGQFKAKAKKHELSNLTLVDPKTIKFGTPPPPQPQPVGSPPAPEVQLSAGEPLLDSAGYPQAVLPGLWLAFGDLAIVNDQAAIIVSPDITQTHEVYGSKENLSFTLEFKANDLETASDLSEAVKQYLLISGRINTEADGLTIFEASRDFRGEQRDPSGTTSSYVYDVTLSAAADWKVFKPMVTRLLSFELMESPKTPDFLGKLQAAQRVSVLGSHSFLKSTSGFVTSYR